MSKKAVQQPDPRREFTAIVPRVTVEMLADWDLDEGIGVFSRFSSILRDLGELASIAANPEANLTVCLYKGQKVVAYCVRRPAPDIDRWGEMEPPILHEVFGETSRSWRDLKLMGPLLDTVVNDESNQERVLYIVGYSWTWDLDASKKTLAQYRDTIIHLLGRLGFKQYPTNEPNVSLRPENLFMARIGEKVPTKLNKRFTNLLFGIYD